MSGSPGQDSLLRVTRLTLHRFRGWTGEYEVELDADIVLVTAPNGRGKSSLIEALSRVLNGTSFHDDGENKAVKAQGDWHLAVRTDEGREIPSDDPDWRERLDPLRVDVPEPEVLRRATVFLQDRLDEQFEGPARSGRNVLAFIAPFPPWLHDYLDALNGYEQRWRSEVPREEPEHAIPSARRRRDQAASEAGAAVALLLLQQPPVGDQQALFGNQPVEQLARLAHVATGREADPNDVDAWLDKLDEWLSTRARWSETHRHKVADATAQVDAARTALRAHEAEWPDLHELASWARGIVDLERLVELLEGLAGAPPQWSDASGVRQRLAGLPSVSRERVPLPDELLTELPAELARVDRVRADRYRAALVSWVEFWKAREAERTAVKAKLAEAEAELDRLESDRYAAEAAAKLKRFRDAHGALRVAEGRREQAKKQRERWERLQPVRAAVAEQTRWCEALRAGQLDEVVAHRLEASMDAVMRHFVVAGLESARQLVRVRVGAERTVRPDLADDRSLDTHVSTGQKAQLALAALLGSNALLQRWLPHRLLLLDDVSTALDLTNLAAECALLRKFAYTTDKGRRRQVVIASHHDQLTHRLFDLLLPPGDFTMREIRITDWSLDRGPTIEPSMINPTGAATDEARQRLAERLGSAFGMPHETRSHA